MNQWKWWLVALSLIVSNGIGFGLFAVERSKHAVAGASTETLAKRMAIAEIETEKLKQEQRRIIDKASHMTRRLKVRTAKAATRNASSVFLESVPYVGIAAMLAVTAADLHDACETMKDIDSLHASMGLEPTDAKEVCGLTIPSAKHVSSRVKKQCGRSKDCEPPEASLEDDMAREGK
jgi:hypothetical protein